MLISYKGKHNSLTMEKLINTTKPRALVRSGSCDKVPSTGCSSSSLPFSGRGQQGQRPVRSSRTPGGLRVSPSHPRRAGRELESSLRAPVRHGSHYLPKAHPQPHHSGGQDYNVWIWGEDTNTQTTAPSDQTLHHQEWDNLTLHAFNMTNYVVFLPKMHKT